MNLIGINEITDGILLAEDVISHDGVVYLQAGIELKKRHIKLLENLDVDFIYVKTASTQVQESKPLVELKAYKNFNKEFKKTLTAYKHVFTRAQAGLPIDLKEIGQVLDPLVEGILNDNDILGSLRSIQITDEYTFRHSINVSLIASMIGKWMGYDAEKLKLLSIAGLLHDVGKCKVPLDVLNKPSRLSEKEFEIIKTHALFGFSILTESGQKNIDILSGVMSHHEKMDGTGYPKGLKGENIHPFARIIAVADVFDAMTSNRCYRARMSSFEVAEELSRLSAFHLDVGIVTLFIKNISRFFVGNEVRLSSGEVGKVVMLNPSLITRPLVMIRDQFIDLSKSYQLQIIDVVS